MGQLRVGTKFKTQSSPAANAIATHLSDLNPDPLLISGLASVMPARYPFLSKALAVG